MRDMEELSIEEGLALNVSLKSPFKKELLCARLNGKIHSYSIQHRLDAC